MEITTQSKNEAFADGAVTRSQGYNEYFNPYREDKQSDLYRHWLKGWRNQDTMM